MIANFKILEVLKSCNKASLARACDNRGKKVLVKYNKKMSSNRYMNAELKSEYELTRSLDPAKVLSALSFNTEDYHSAIIYEDNGGDLLSDRLQNPTTFSEKLRIATLMTEAVHYLHTNGLLHRNINPHAFFISKNDSNISIVDLSLATKLQQDEVSSLNNILIGQAAYTSPEQTGRSNLPTDNRSDLYSLGATLYEVFSGQQIYADGEQDQLSIVYKQLTQKVKPLYELDSSIAQKASEIVARLLEKSPNNRYQSSFGLLQDLKRIEKEWLETSEISHFDIGQEDSPEKLQLSRKLYGREKQISQLMDGFQIVASGQNKIVLVSGYSGVGKSALIKEAQKKISENKGLFTSGKCEQFSTDQPFYVFSQALRLLLRQISNLQNDQQNKWRDIFQTKIGENFTLLTELVPELAPFFDTKITTSPEQNTLVSDRQFMMTFVKFVNAFTSQNNPLVIFLDDLQWADTASLRLINELLDQNSYLMIIGTYRDNEIDETHLLSKIIRDLKSKKIKFGEIHLHPLNLQDIKRLLADSLWLTLDQAEPLAATCIKKTQGNPFYVNQFITMLNEEGYIFYSYEKGAWHWDQQAIDVVNVTSNIVDLMIDKLKKFSNESLEILKLAANLGNQFSLEKLQKVAHLGLQDVYKRLWPMISNGYILPVNENYRFSSSEDLLSQASFMFLHDRVQQAAFQLIPQEHLAEFKWQFGMRLLKGTLKENLESNIFEITDQLNAGKYYASINEKKVLVDLNLLAARKAKRSTAFTYAQKTMLNVYQFSCEDLDYRRLDVFNTLAEVSYLIGDFELAEKLYIQAMKVANTALEIVSVIAIQTAQYQIQGRFAEAIALQKKGLGVLSIRIPDDTTEIEAQFMEGFKSIDSFISTHNIDDLIDHSSMENDNQKAAMKLLMGMWYASYLSGKTPLNLLSTIIMTQLSLEHGHDDISPFAYVNYSLAIISVYNRYEQADKFGLLAVKLAENRKNKLIKASTYFLYATFTQHWNHPLQKTVPYYNMSYDLALQSGDLATLGYICAVRGSDTLALGEKLQSVHETLTDDIQLLSKHKQLDMKDCVTVGALQSVKALLGLTHSLDSFDDDDFNENIFLKNYEHAPLHLGYFYNAKLRHAYLTNSSKNIQLSLLEKAELISASVPGQNKIPESTFFAALIALRFADNENDPLFLLSQAKLAMFEEWSEACPHNYLHKYLLLKAESDRVCGNDTKIIDLYSRAIEEASNSGFNNILAICNECFANYWHAKNKYVLAKTFITVSYQEYRQWGAITKLQQLREYWSNINFIDDHSFNKIYKPQDSINLQTVQDINLLISSEIHLDSLLEKLMFILLKNAGAGWGALIQTNDINKELWLEAAGDKDHIGVLLHQPLIDAATKQKIPESIVKRVIDSQELCIINRPFEHTEFYHDVYFQRKSPLTVAGLPVIHQGNMIAVVYLENDLIENAFSQEHISLLNVIASQAAISLSHAFLYQSLEKRVIARTEALASAKLKAEESTIAKSNFLANMSHEIRTPMNAVIGLNRLLKRTPLSIEQQSLVSKVSDSSDSLLSLINNILDFSKIEAHKLSLERIKFNLDDVLQKVTAICGQIIYEKDLEFIIEVDRSIPMLLIGDPLRLQQILVNLINNAVKFTDEGFIKISIHSGPSVDQGHDLVFEIMDTGIGIGEEEQKRLFSSFYQVDASTTRKYGGTGLGLAISKELAQLMGGELRATSIKDKGSCFTFNAIFRPANIVADSTEYIDLALLSNLNVLVVDDNETAIQVILDVLSSFGISAKSETSGLAAIRRFEIADEIDEPFDLVIMDWKMPQLDGIETCKKITAKSNRATPFMLMISAYDKNEAMALASNTEIKSFIEKPLNASSLIDNINVLMFGKKDTRLATTTLKEEVTPPDLSDYHLLLVEDNEINQQVAQGFLMDTMINVTIAENGREAIHKVEQSSFDCILMDIQMPVMDGITATQEIRKNFNKEQLPIIAMTAHALRSDVELSFDSGMNAHITKPIDPDILYHTLAKLLNIEKKLERPPVLVDFETLEIEKKTLEYLYNIEQLEVDKSIYRLQNKASLYLSLVKDFWTKNKCLYEKIEKYLDANEYDELFLITHSLKSTAQYIGANKLAQYASVLQESTKHQKITPIQVSDLLSELYSIISQLSPLFAKTEKSEIDKILNYPAAILLINQLRLLLARAEAASESVSWSLHDLSRGTVYEKQISNVHYLICDFEFESATVELDNLEKSIIGR